MIKKIMSTLNGEVSIERCNNVSEIKEAVEKVFRQYEYLLPKSQSKVIFIKPNLNNDMSALTGGTTDLRILVAVIESLKRRNYSNIVIGDGPNCGVYHYNINVLERLKIKRIAEHYCVEAVDLNHVQSVEVQLTTNKAKVAKICLNCDFMINLPKIKTHTEAHLSLALKNLVGCFVGLDKRKVHSNFFENIIRMNQIIQPDLHIVDGLIIMEGDGPSTGIPKKLGYIFAGENPFLIDAVISKTLGIHPQAVPYLRIAIEKNIISREQLEYLDAVEQIARIKPAQINPVKNFLLKNYFIIPRYWKIFDWIFNLEITSNLLTSMGIRQDNFIKEDVKIDKISVNKDACDKRCEDYCPMELDILSYSFKFPDARCIECLYCFMVSPEGGIEIEGGLGYLTPHLRKYKEYIEAL